MLKKIVISLILLALIALGVVFAVRQKKTSDNSGKITVATSFYPLYFFADQIGGDRITLTNLTPAGAEPHEYELTPQDTAKVESSDLLILNGGGLEPWAESVQKNIDTTKTRVVTVGKDLVTQEMIEEEQPIADPHIWLSPVLAQKIADAIAAGMRAADPTNPGR